MKTTQYIRDLENLRKKIDDVEDEEIINSLVKLLCVRTAGLLEVFLKTRISEYSKGKVPKEITRFMTAKFKDITNLKSSKFSDVLSAFSEDWSREFNDYMEEHEQEKSSLDSVVAQRHMIAHGQSSNISQAYMSQYFNDVKNIISFLDRVIR